MAVVQADKIQVVAQLKDEVTPGLNRMTQNMSQQMQRGSNALGNLGNMATSVKGNLAAMAATSLVAVSTFAIKSSMEIEDLTASFETLTGSADSAARQLQQVRDLANKSPLETKDVAQADKTLLSFGVGAYKTVDILRQLSDISLGNKERFQSLALVFGQVSSAGKLQGQDLLQMINAGFNPLNEMVKTTGKSYALLRKEMEQGKITSDMMAAAVRSATSEGGLFFEGTKKAAETTSGKLSTLQDSVSNLGVAFAENTGLAKGFNKALSGITLGISGGSDFINEMGNRLKGLGTLKVNDSVKKAIKEIDDAIITGDLNKIESAKKTAWVHGQKAMETISDFDAMASAMKKAEDALTGITAENLAKQNALKEQQAEEERKRREQLAKEAKEAAEFDFRMQSEMLRRVKSEKDKQAEDDKKAKEDADKLAQKLLKDEEKRLEDETKAKAAQAKRVNEISEMLDREDAQNQEKEEKRIEKAIDTEWQLLDAKMQTAQLAINTLSTLAEATKANADIIKGIKIGEALMSGASASVSMWAAAYRDLPAYAAPIYGGINQALIAANTAAQIAIISQQQFATGGFVKGSGQGDNVQIAANGGEYVMTTKDQRNFVDAIKNNRSQSKAQQTVVNVNFNGDVYDSRGVSRASKRLSRVVVSAIENAGRNRLVTPRAKAAMA